MSIYPSPDKLDAHESKYALVIMAAKRSRQIKDGARRLVESTSPNPLTVALEELADGQIIARAVEDAGVAAYKDALKPNEPSLEDIIAAGPVLALDADPDSPEAQAEALRNATIVLDDDDILGIDRDEDDLTELAADDFELTDTSPLMEDPDEEDDLLNEDLDEEEE